MCGNVKKTAYQLPSFFQKEFLLKFLRFDIMQVQVEIGFEQLVQLAKRLPVTQWSKINSEVENKNAINNSTTELQTFLLSAPIFNKRQLTEIAKTRKAITKWRTK